MPLQTDEGMLLIPIPPDEITETDLLVGGTGIPQYLLEMPVIDIAEYYVDEPVFDTLPVTSRREKLQAVANLIREKGLPAIQSLTGKNPPPPPPPTRTAGPSGGIVLGALAIAALLAFGIGFRRG